MVVSYLAMASRSCFVAVPMRVARYTWNRSKRRAGMLVCWRPHVPRRRRTLALARPAGVDRNAVDRRRAAPGVELWIARRIVDDVEIGYFELELLGDDVDIRYFGLLPGFLGQGFGGWLLTRAVERAWAIGRGGSRSTPARWTARPRCRTIAPAVSR